ncbi:DUF2087 domain-containing protein [Cognatiyoonia sp. IB215182]|uniref:DUF2087 domain-containing protein n=1 Tax=Cognatiyoonia sp. IB215182 TaxID=3097353 RepID=UPI002A10D514|nr:DUF2087 domain-containing protein [Cognatiyoonia sp. IB215182]MDX8353756.1 DUF2087 domain-containing protein [Cognatiyoonia sp. IB215182]
MTKTPIPLRADDLTSFARALSQQLGEASPSHLTLMNMIARAAGFQNVQHMRSASAAERRLAKPDDSALTNARLVERTLHQFDDLGRLQQWPSKQAVQTLSLWALWSTLPANTHLNEPTVNALLDAEHLFEDVATLRRTMISCNLLTRNRDGTNYRRIEQKPPADAIAVIHVLTARRRRRRTANAEMDHA